MKQPSSPARKGTKKAPAKKTPVKAVRKTKTVPLEASKKTATVKKRRDLTSSQRKSVPPVVVNLDANGRNLGGRPETWTFEHTLAEAEAMLEILKAEDAPGSKIKTLFLAQLTEYREYSRKTFINAYDRHKGHAQFATLSDVWSRIKGILEGRIAMMGAVGKTHPVFARFCLAVHHDWREVQHVETTVTEKRVSNWGDGEVTEY